MKKRGRFIFRFLLLIFVVGAGIAIFSSWQLIKQSFLLTKTIVVKHKPENPPRTFKGVYAKRPKSGEMLGSVEIPSISLNSPLVHGTLEKHLKLGVGHYAGSVLPGENGNVIISGHRDTVFKKLGKVAPGDLIILNTKLGSYTYKMKSHKIVDKEDRTIIVPSDHEMLTVTTCYPFNYVGSAPERYIIFAEFVKHTPNSTSSQN